MIQRKTTFYLGLFIFLVPFLGIPSSWRTFFIIIAGLGLIALSVRIILPRKPGRTRGKRTKVSDVSVKDSSISPKDDTIETQDNSATTDIQ